MMVTFGATGDLSGRKLLPALCNLAKRVFCRRRSQSSVRRSTT